MISDNVFIAVINGVFGVALLYIGIQSKKTHDIVNSQRTLMIEEIDSLKKEIMSLKDDKLKSSAEIDESRGNAE